MKATAILLLLVLVILFVIFGPFITIWALNLLFGTHIPFTFATWFAALWISGLVASSKISSSK